MKIIDGLKLKGQPAEIPDCSRDDLPEFFKEMRFTKGAEIGVARAGFTEKFCEAGLFMYGIDPWGESFNMKWSYRRSVKRLERFENKKLIVKTSMEALNDFEDESLDFVYIDGNHELKYVIEDLVEWTKKVKTGGVISGHDYIHPSRLVNKSNPVHVKFAVDAFTQSYNIKNWYLLGRLTQIYPNEKRDRFRSWMWIKS